jgi:hypothetical protein
VPGAPDARPDGDHDWRHHWLRVNVVLREMTRLVFRVDRDARPVLKAELNRAISMRAKLKRAPWWN